MPKLDEMVTGDEARLWTLLEERTLPGADLKRIDRRIWDLYGEDWAVMITDLAGFSRQAAAFGVVHFLKILHEKRKLLFPVISEHDGILTRIDGDSFVVLFRRVESAIRCGVEMQKACSKASERRTAEDQLPLCLGVGYGTLLRIGPHDVYGAEVSAAAKLGQETAKAHEILVTQAVRDAAKGAAEVQFLDLGLAVGGSAQNYRVRYVR